MAKRRTQISSIAFLIASFGVAPAYAQQADEQSAAAAPEQTSVSDPGRETYLPSDFTRFAPRNALDMLEEVPGFSIEGENSERGLGQASGNVLINGERIASKSTSATDQLSRIPVGNVVRIDIVDGASLDIPGLTGRVANVIAESGGKVSGQFEWRGQMASGPAGFRWSQGDASVSGTQGLVDYTLAFNNGSFYGGSEGPNLITDGATGIVDARFNQQISVMNRPTATGRFQFDLPGSAVANLGLSHYWTIFNAREHEYRVDSGISAFDERLRTSNDEYGYEISGDIDFAFGPGRMRLIGLESYENGNFITQSIISETGLDDSGRRFGRDSSEGERIARGEYSWGMLGADWQVSLEGAFNRLDNVSSLFGLDGTSGEFVEISFPAGTGGVRETRYDASLSYGRPITDNLALQITAGGEYSKLSQTGSNALARTFQRPKGSASLAWSPGGGFDVNLSVERKVGQLSFGDFLANVNVTDDNSDAGNNQLLPQQSWETRLQISKNLGDWGSTTLRLFDQKFEDYVTVIPIMGGGESRGNIDMSHRFGMDLDTTLKLDPIGFYGAQLDVRIHLEGSSLIDPVTGLSHRFDGQNDNSARRNFQMDFRHDIPRTDLAWGFEFRDTVQTPYYRTSEIGVTYNITRFGAIFVEHKDVFGMTVRARVANLFNENLVLYREVYDGLRGSSPLLFIEDRKRAVGTVFNLTVSGSF